ncbi:unnamed protein product [Amoebophrya sp. A25]|nr:unnamed protein product [Amoebophrya sp. A25]|eukprot:GSA25T00020879001.1
MLDPRERMTFVQLLMARAIQRQQAIVERANALVEDAGRLLDAAKVSEKAEVLRKRRIVAMTTDGAAIQLDVLREYKPDVVIVEEAGELLEPRNVAPLLPDLKHLILIGDPDQLPPRPDNYELKKYWDFGVSLMERLVHCGIPHRTLMTQSRMRPEIAELTAGVRTRRINDLTTSSLYQNHNSDGVELNREYPLMLNNDAVVDKLERPACLTNNVFFWDTTTSRRTSTFTTSTAGTREYFEKKTTVGVCNGEEALRVVLLAEHLIREGHAPSEIAILAAYKGQMREIRRLIEKHHGTPTTRTPVKGQAGGKAKGKGKNSSSNEQGGLAAVAVSTVDMFQGDQRDIVLVSFCRSNDSHNGGFLKKDEGRNRLIVAKTRARLALIFVGDRRCLETDFPKVRSFHSKQKTVDRKNPTLNPVWSGLFHDLESRQAVGPSLFLQCCRHPGNQKGFICAQELQDDPFVCRELCDNTFPTCGHRCFQQCHGGPCPESKCPEPVEVHCPVKPRRTIDASGSWKLEELDENDDTHPSWTEECGKLRGGLKPKCRARERFSCERCRGGLIRECWQEESAIPCEANITMQCPECLTSRVRKCYQDEKDCPCEHVVMLVCPKNKAHKRKLPCHQAQKVNQAIEDLKDPKKAQTVPKKLKALVQCKEVCGLPLGCEHSCELLCWQPCEKKEDCKRMVLYECDVCESVSQDRFCNETIEERRKRLPCTHLVEDSCPDCSFPKRKRACLRSRTFQEALEVCQPTSTSEAPPDDSHSQGTSEACSGGIFGTHFGFGLQQGAYFPACANLVQQKCERGTHAYSLKCHEKQQQQQHGNQPSKASKKSTTTYLCREKVPYNCSTCNGPTTLVECHRFAQYRCQHPVPNTCKRCHVPFQRKCSDPPEKHKCRERCNKLLPLCGHRCERDCYHCESIGSCPMAKEECPACARDKYDQWQLSNESLASTSNLLQQQLQQLQLRKKIDVWKLEFTQANISPDFQSEKSIFDARDEWLLKNGNAGPSLEKDFDSYFTNLQVFVKPVLGRIRLFSLDNRRLWLLKACAPHALVSVQWSNDFKGFAEKHEQTLRARRGLHPHEIQIRNHKGPPKYPTNTMGGGGTGVQHAAQTREPNRTIYYNGPKRR